MSMNEGEMKDVGEGEKDWSQERVNLIETPVEGNKKKVKIPAVLIEGSNQV